MLGSVKVLALGTGDNLYTELHKWKSVHETECPAMSVWSEEKHLLMLWSKEDASGSFMYFIATPDKKLIAISITIGGENLYLIDINNDSIIDVTTSFFYMPYEFIKRKTKIVSQDTSVLRMLNHFYTISMQEDDLTEFDKGEVQFWKLFFDDTTLSNRHLVYIFSTYQRLITEANQKHIKSPSKICIPLAQSFADECNLVYKKIPPLACVYVVESLLNDTTQTEKAARTVHEYLKSYPGCIPLLVYDYQLEKDEMLKAEKLSSLKQNHAGHWMVKQL